MRCVGSPGPWAESQWSRLLRGQGVLGSGPGGWRPGRIPMVTAPAWAGRVGHGSCVGRAGVWAWGWRPGRIPVVTAPAWAGRVGAWAWGWRPGRIPVVTAPAWAGRVGAWAWGWRPGRIPVITAPAWAERVGAKPWGGPWSRPWGSGFHTGAPCWGPGIPRGFLPNPLYYRTKSFIHKKTVQKRSG